MHMARRLHGLYSDFSRVSVTIVSTCFTMSIARVYSGSVPMRGCPITNFV